jgi:predicted transcriptional regulator
MKLEQYLFLKKLTLCEFAEKAGLSRPTLYKVLNGNPVYRTTMRRIQNASEGLVDGIEVFIYSRNLRKAKLKNKS